MFKIILASAVAPAVFGIRSESFHGNKIGKDQSKQKDGIQCISDGPQSIRADDKQIYSESSFMQSSSRVVLAVGDEVEIVGLTGAEGAYLNGKSGKIIAKGAQGKWKVQTSDMITQEFDQENLKLLGAPAPQPAPGPRPPILHDVLDSVAESGPRPPILQDVLGSVAESGPRPPNTGTDLPSGIVQDLQSFAAFKLRWPEFKCARDVQHYDKNGSWIRNGNSIRAMKDKIAGHIAKTKRPGTDVPLLGNDNYLLVHNLNGAVAELSDAVDGMRVCDLLSADSVIEIYLTKNFIEAKRAFYSGRLGEDGISTQLREQMTRNREQLDGDLRRTTDLMNSQ